MNATLADEIESIKSIYEYFECAHDPKTGVLSIDLLPYPAEAGSAANMVGLTIKLSNLENYPIDRPVVTYAHYLNIDGQRQREIEEIVEEILTSHAEFEVLFDIYTALTTYLQENNIPVRSIHDVMSGVEAPVLVEHEEIGIDDLSGSSECETPEIEDPNAGKLADKDVVPPDYRVTDEQFKQWSEAFKLEMFALGIWRDPDDTDRRPTGRQIFQAGMAKDLTVT